jgi:predicted NAD/FAD-dependent oxidoreductase
MLALGRSGLPAQGMGAIASQISSSLAPDQIRFDARVARLDDSRVALVSGEVLTARAVVVATEGPEAHRLLGWRVPDPGSLAAACCWFAVPTAPIRGPVLTIDGDDSGPMKNLAVVSEVCPSYAPVGRALVAAAVPGRHALDPSLAKRVREQLGGWFGSYTSDWEHLRTDVVRHGHPAQLAPLHPKRAVALGDGLFVCGDHRDTASIQGAMFSGERAAAAVSQFLSG